MSETGGGRETVECCDVISIHTKASRTHRRFDSPSIVSIRCCGAAAFLPL